MILPKMRRGSGGATDRRRGKRLLKGLVVDQSQQSRLDAARGAFMSGVGPEKKVLKHGTSHFKQPKCFTIVRDGLVFN